MKAPQRQIKSITDTLTEHGCRDAIEYFPNLIAAIEYYSNQFKPKRAVVNTQIESIKNHVCLIFGVDPAVVFNKTRVGEIVSARQLIATLYKFGLRMSYATVGMNIGDKDHATVLHSIKKVHDQYETYNDYRNTVDEIINHLFILKSDRRYIIDRIIDPHKDRRELLSKFTHTIHRNAQVERSAV